MTVRIHPKPFNALVRSAKKIVDPDSPRPACRRIRLEAFEAAPGAWILRASATDSRRIAEDTMKILDVPDASGPRCAGINPPRLAAKGPVTVEMLEGRTVISFDDVSFTTKDDGGAQESIGRKDDVIRTFMSDAKTRIAMKPGRSSITCNAKYLLDAAEAMKSSKDVRVDIGGPTDPIILTGRDDYSDLVRVVLPMRTRISDAEYREQLARTVFPEQNSGGSARQDSGNINE